jgi:gamma-glutamyltranspeptidase
MSNTHRGEPGAGREPICFEYRETAPAKATAPMITGSPGGRTIISTVVCVLVNTLEYGMPLREAIMLRGCTTAGFQTSCSSRARPTQLPAA